MVQSLPPTLEARLPSTCCRYDIQRFWMPLLTLGAVSIIDRRSMKRPCASKHHD